MLNAFKNLLTSLVAPNDTQSPAEVAHSLQLSTAVLLVEVMRADPMINAAEEAATMAALRQKFTLTDDELTQLVALAEHTAKGANDYFSFTSRMNEQFSQAQKIKVVELMWQVAYADAHLDANENHLISKIAGLLHVTHGEYIAAKMHAREAAQLKGSA
jgi:uncharacterized tellurite resistance protein B-like protein